MAEGLEMDSNLMEIYHQRMAEIQDVSDVIAVANMQLNKIFTKFAWTRQSLLKESSLETCPIDENHKIHKDNLQSHIQTCSLRKHKIMSVKDRDLPLPPIYNSKSTIVPVFVSKAQYKKLGINIDEDTSMDTPHIINSVRNDDGLLEVDEGINDYKPCNSLDELRFIYSWHKIPKSYILLDITRIPKVQISDWLVENISGTSLSDDLKQCMTNSMICWLNELPTPSQIICYIQDLLGQNSKSFVLRLWKFLAAKRLCLNQQIPEHTRNEFDFYTTTSMNNQVSTVVNKGEMVRKLTIRPSLPMEWVFFKLTAEQKLAIYEDVCKTWRLLKKPLFGISELQMETQEQVRMLTEFDEHLKGEKTRMEVLAELRDYKRRRQSYRGKNKSTKKMSAIEVLRELFEQQMLYLKLIEENKRQHEAENTKKEKDSNSRSVSPNKRGKERKDDQHESGRHLSANRSRDSRRSRSRESRRRSKSKDVRGRSHSRERYRRLNRGRYRERSTEKKPYRDSRDRDERRNQDKNEISNKTYYVDDNSKKKKKRNHDTYHKETSNSKKNSIDNVLAFWNRHFTYENETCTVDSIEAYALFQRSQLHSGETLVTFKRLSGLIPKLRSNANRLQKTQSYFAQIIPKSPPLSNTLSDQSSSKTIDPVTSPSNNNNIDNSSNLNSFAATTTSNISSSSTSSTNSTNINNNSS